MANWGVSMGQNYTEHTPENPGKFLGVMVPTDFYTNGKIPLALNTPSNRKPTAWSNDGTGPSDTYNVVASYIYESDATVQGYVYLFAFYNGQPVALVTGQRDANNDGTMVFKPTANPDVAAAFKQIASGKGIPAKFANASQQKIEANTSVTEDLALKVYWNAKKAEDASFDPTNIDSLYFKNVSNKHVYDMDDVSAVFPNNTYMVGQSKAGLYDVAFQLIGNNKAKVYYILGSMVTQGNDESKKMINDTINEEMSNPKEIEISNVDSGTLEVLKDKLHAYDEYKLKLQE